MSHIFPEWPERWEHFDGILKYDPHESEEVGGELDIGGIPFVNPVWIVVTRWVPEKKRHKPKRKKKRGTKKRKRKR